MKTGELILYLYVLQFNNLPNFAIYENIHCFGLSAKFN